MRNILKPPKTNYVDHYDISKFNLIWNFCWAIIFLLSIVSVSNLGNSSYSSLPNLAAIGIAIAVLVILRATKRYKLIAIVGTLTTLALVSSTFFLLDNVIHYTTPMWMIVNILLAFFVLGQVWGITILVIHFTFFSLYFAFGLEGNLSRLEAFDKMDIADFIIEVAIVALGISYLLMQFIKTNKYAETILKNTNEALQAQNEIITQQNEEKEIMLKEIHHRVKNNLQVITSLLRLQAQELEGEKDINSFTEAINRVKSMALIHEKMYKSDMLANFDLRNYLESLINELIYTYSVKKPIQLDVQSDINNIGSKSIVPISLLFNELISNSIKHGFENQEEGKIHVRVTPCDKEDYFCLKYADNGQWKEETRKSFGLELIDTMTDQLEGEYNLEKSGDGTNYSFTLKVLVE